MQRALTIPGVFLLLCAGLGASTIALKFLSAPWILIEVYWAAFFGLICTGSKNVVRKAVCFNLAFLLIMLATVEAYFHLTREPAVRLIGDSYHTEYMSRHDLLGYGPVPDTSVRVRAVTGDHIIYDVNYTIGRDGLRVTGGNDNDFAAGDDECTLFFGDSFTFGEGVEDHESMPYIVAELLKQKTYNFAFHGYGPHQMLSAIEHGLVDRVVDCHPRTVIYQALSLHVARSAGYASWDRHGPRYVLQNGQVNYAGHFDDGQSKLGKAGHAILRKANQSHLFRQIVGSDRHAITEQDRQLFLGIVNAACQRLSAIYPGSSFHVLLWGIGGDEIMLRELRDALEQRFVDVHMVSDILPDFANSRLRYEIPYDRHPSPFAHRLIAEYVVKNIAGAKEPADGRWLVSGDQRQAGSVGETSCLAAPMQALS